MFKLRNLLLTLTLTGLVGPLAGASPLPTESTRMPLAQAPAGAGSTVQPSIDAAVEAAFAAARQAEGPRVRGRLRIGTIRRVQGGFAWVEPEVSPSGVGAMRSVRVRLRLRPEDVAIYGIHPRSGRAGFDRANESVTRRKRQQDPLHRPLYVLTPSRRVVRYPAVSDLVEVVRREGGGVPRR